MVPYMGENVKKRSRLSLLFGYSAYKSLNDYPMKNKKDGRNHPLE